MSVHCLTHRLLAPDFLSVAQLQEVMVPDVSLYVRMGFNVAIRNRISSKLLEAILQRGANINYMPDGHEQNHTALSFWTGRGDCDKVLFLLQRGACCSLNEPLQNLKLPPYHYYYRQPGRNALMSAFGYHQKAEMVTLLLEYGAVVDHRVFLMASCQYLSSDSTLIVELLLKSVFGSPRHSSMNNMEEVFRMALNCLLGIAIVRAKHLICYRWTKWVCMLYTCSDYHYQCMKMAKFILKSGSSVVPGLVLKQGVAANALLSLAQIYKYHLELNRVLVWPNDLTGLEHAHVVLPDPPGWGCISFDHQEVEPAQLDRSTLLTHAELLLDLVKKTAGLCVNADTIIRHLHSLRCGTLLQPESLSNLSLSVVRDVLIRDGRWKLGVTVSEPNLPGHLQKRLAMQDFSEKLDTAHSAFFRMNPRRR